MKNINHSGVCVLVLALTITLANAQYSPVANIVEKWTNDVNWVVYGNAGKIYTNETMGAKKVVGDPPLSGNLAVLASTGSSGGLFTGNYSNSAITHVSFDVKRMGVSKTASLCFKSASGKIWSRQIDLPAAAGEWGHVEVPMTYSSDWTTLFSGDSVQFESDRSQVVQIYIFDVFNGSGEQSVFIDNFSVVGPWEKGPLQADMMPSYWLMANGLPVADGQADLDNDHDGAKNYDEYLAGTDPLDASSKFKVEIDKDQEGRPVLRWKHENYRAYEVLRTSDLTKPFNSVTAAVQSDGRTDEALAPTGSENASFYKIQIGVKP